MTVINWSEIKPTGGSTALNCQSMACNGDGTAILAAYYTGSAYLSKNSGSSFSAVRTTGNYTCAAMDPSGKIYLLGTAGTGDLYYSVNSGVNWTGSGITGAYGYCAMSANGKVFYGSNASATHGITFIFVLSLCKRATLNRAVSISKIARSMIGTTQIMLQLILQLIILTRFNNPLPFP
jgi:hypothetical protein